MYRHATGNTKRVVHIHCDWDPLRDWLPWQTDCCMYIIVFKDMSNTAFAKIEEVGHGLIVR